MVKLCLKMSDVVLSDINICCNFHLLDLER